MYINIILLCTISSDLRVYIRIYIHIYIFISVPSQSMGRAGEGGGEVKKVFRLEIN